MTIGLNISGLKALLVDRSHNPFGGKYQESVVREIRKLRLRRRELETRL